MLIPCTSKSGTSFDAALASSAARAKPQSASANKHTHASRKKRINPPWKGRSNFTTAAKQGQDKTWCGCWLGQYQPYSYALTAIPRPSRIGKMVANKSLEP